MEVIDVDLYMALTLGANVKYASPAGQQHFLWGPPPPRSPSKARPAGTIDSHLLRLV